MIKIDTISKSYNETFQLGLDFSKKIKAGDAFGLIGELASGKTSFVKGVLKGLDYKHNVTSPTFTLINEYNAKIKVIHIDFYRETNIKRWNNLGFNDILNDDAIIIIEWADLLLDLLPENMLKIYFNHLSDNRRKIYTR
tara:strand:+ start:161 stop:577 length:417 start_codon:yes stop_codon:yes gene_type:complete